MNDDEFLDALLRTINDLNALAYHARRAGNVTFADEIDAMRDQLERTADIKLGEFELRESRRR
jgi:hypothetical protein